MTDPAPTSAAHLLGITPGHTVRLVGDGALVTEVLSPLPEGVTVSSLGSEPADVGLLVVVDEADLRERLFTELSGLRGATSVWVVTDPTGPLTGPAIREAVELVAWRTTSTTVLGGSLTATRLEQA